MSQKQVTAINKSNYYNVMIIVVLLIAAIYMFASIPLFVGDTDLWYHLSGGRYFSTNASPAYSSFFSFIQPERDRSNYFWLFQVIVYKIYSSYGDLGLIVFRTAFYILILSIILSFLYKKQRQNIPYIAFIIILYAIGLIDRYSNLRPHVFTYTIIAAFIYIIEFHPRKAFVLPVLALIWSNVHGIEYPVMLLIIAAYSAEALLLRIRPRAGNNNEKNTVLIISLVISAAMIFFTPNGPGLLKVPFIPTDYASIYIKELRPFSFAELFAFVVSPLSHDIRMFGSVLVLMAFLAFSQSVLNKTIKLSQAILFIGGAFLLFRGLRFFNEFVLLALPCIAKADPFENLFKADKTKGVVNTVFILIAVLTLNNALTDMKRLPSTMPRGVTQFLLGLDAGGNILNTHNNGGYLQWMLYPKYKIFMDMEVPHLFTDYDMFASLRVFKEEIVLRNVINKYNPAFITIPITYSSLGDFSKHYTNYTLIFFDDAEVLYVNKLIYPDIAAKYEIREINPFALRIELTDQTPAGKSDEYIREARGIFDIYPSLLVTQSLARIYVMKGEYEQALPFIDAAIKFYPEIPTAYNIKADMLSRLHKYEEAVEVLNISFDKASDAEKKGIYHQLYMCYLNMKQERKAYDALKKAVDVFSEKLSFDDVYNLAVLSMKFGKPYDQRILLNIVLLKAPLEKKDLIVNIEKTLNELKK
ncbi:MAG: tetratricopeptide repeat protein [Nitrospirae bacterium]|nr:tetratricopeptide repeat protein [Nitrospirota bacterium]